MKVQINNIDDLRSEVARLKEVEQLQKTALGRRFTGPSAIFSTVLSLFPKSAATDGLQSSFANQDIVGLLSRIVLPFTLNKTVFRNSNFIVKTLVGLVSQKASHFISEDSVGGIWDKAKSIISKFSGAKKEKNKPNDLKAYGIPEV